MKNKENASNKENSKKKGKKLKIFLIVLSVIAILITGVTIWQWNNIVAVYYFIKYSEEDLTRLNEENKRILNETIGELNIEAPRELSDEEIEALESGAITKEDAIDISLGIATLEEKLGLPTPEQNAEDNSESTQSNTADTSRENAKNTDNGNSEVSISGGNSTSNKQMPQSQPQKETSKMSELVAELYVLKSTYIARLDGLEAKGKSEYSQTPEGNRTTAWKNSMIAKYSGEISAWESECDAKVEGIISQIKEELKKTGGDTSVIKKIRTTYENEKQIKKAQYMNKYMK